MMIKLKGIAYILTFILLCQLNGQEEHTVTVHSVPIERATPESLKGYGRVVYPEDFETARVTIVTWPAQGWRPVEIGTGNEGGTVEGSFYMKWKGNRLYAINHAVQRKYLTGWATYPAQASKLPVVAQENRRSIFTFEANYHPDGGQLFMPKECKPFVALLALPGDDVTPDDFRAFYFDGSFGIHVDPGIWHQPLFPVFDSMEFYDRQGKVHACIGINFPEEFNCCLSVPLVLPEE